MAKTQVFWILIWSPPLCSDKSGSIPGKHDTKDPSPEGQESCFSSLCSSTVFLLPIFLTWLSSPCRFYIIITHAMIMVACNGWKSKKQFSCICSNHHVQAWPISFSRHMMVAISCLQLYWLGFSVASTCGYKKLWVLILECCAGRCLGNKWGTCFFNCQKSSLHIDWSGMELR